MARAPAEPAAALTRLVLNFRHSMLRQAAVILALAVAGPALAQEATPVYQSQKSSFGFHVDGVLRQEWTQDIFVSPEETRDEDRTRFQIRPRIEFGGDRFKVGVGGDFNFSSDENVPDVKPPLLRDNYKSKDARLDLAFAKIEPMGWLRLEGGRFVMPITLTEMIWDKDLRPQGGALTLVHKDGTGVDKYSLTGLYAQGSHVFEDEDVKMYMASAQATFMGQNSSSLQFIGSYAGWQKINGLESMIRRQNTRLAGALVKKYDVVDIQARVRTAFEPPFQIVADYCWNAAEDTDNKGLWLAATVGSIVTARAKVEYVYSKVDKDATLAAYGTDDFFWVTGWEGHKGEIATQASKKGSVHLIGQLQRFKDSPRPEERDHWVRRFRIEARFSY
jgi:hypothetical protein